MNNFISMSAEFERQKNVKASAITFGTAAALLLLIILIKWPIPTVPQPVVEEFMEVNLGSSDQGFGSDQPMLPGTPAPEEQTAYTPPQPVQAVESNTKSIETDDRDETAPVIKNPPVTSTNATKINDQNKTVKTTPNTQPVVTNTPPQPKATMAGVRGGNGNGGNGADSYQKGGNEGIAGGTGDQGRPGGDPNSRNYSGSPRNLGVRVVNIPAQNFEDDFNESGKIALDIVVNENGKIVSATYQPRGSTLPRSSKNYGIAQRRAGDLKLPKYDGGFKQTFIFNFNVN